MLRCEDVKSHSEARSCSISFIRSPTSLGPEYRKCIPVLATQKRIEEPMQMDQLVY